MPADFPGSNAHHPLATRMNHQSKSVDAAPISTDYHARQEITVLRINTKIWIINCYFIPKDSIFFLYKNIKYEYLSLKSENYILFLNQIFLL